MIQLCILAGAVLPDSSLFWLSRRRKIFRVTFRDNWKKSKFLTSKTTFQAAVMSLPEEIKHLEVATLRFNLKSLKRFHLHIKVGLPGIEDKPTNF
jgi:hypothetical protein